MVRKTAKVTMPGSEKDLTQKKRMIEPRVPQCPNNSAFTGKKCTANGRSEKKVPLILRVRYNYISDKD